MADFFELYPWSVDSRAINQAVEALGRGELIIYPTDTNMAVGCSALDRQAIERLCRLKGINPEKQTLTLVCDSIGQAAQFARIDNRAFAILRANLPGPFTFILPPAP